MINQWSWLPCLSFVFWKSDSNSVNYSEKPASSSEEEVTDDEASDEDNKSGEDDEASDTENTIEKKTKALQEFKTKEEAKQAFKDLLREKVSSLFFCIFFNSWVPLGLFVQNS